MGNWCNEECREKFRDIFERLEDPRLKREPDRARKQQTLSEKKIKQGEYSSSSTERNVKEDECREGVNEVMEVRDLFRLGIDTQRGTETLN